MPKRQRRVHLLYVPRRRSGSWHISQEGGVVTNGMSYRDRASGAANSALLCDVRVTDFGSEDVLAGVEFQEKYERLAFQNGGGFYHAPKSTWGRLRDSKAPEVEGSLPEFAAQAFREAMPHLGKKSRASMTMLPLLPRWKQGVRRRSES